MDDLEEKDVNTAMLFRDGKFLSHSGLELDWKIDVDALSLSDLETLARKVADHYHFANVFGVPQGGLLFADALRGRSRPQGPTLIVDDVYTTGDSIERSRRARSGSGYTNIIGIVIFSRVALPADHWVKAMFTLGESFK